MSFGQKLADPNITYAGKHYNYTIRLPKTFSPETKSQKNTDLLFKDKFGASISINITDRLPSEYEITAHDYTKEMLEETMRQGIPNYQIIETEKIIIDGAKSFRVISIGEHPKLKTMTAFLYHKDKSLVITCSAPKENFDNYITLFTNSLKSIRFK